MKRRVHLYAWFAVLAALGLLLWPIQPGVSLLDLPGAFGGGTARFPSGPVTILDALVTGKSLQGTNLVRLVIAGGLLGGAAVAEFLARGRRSANSSSRTLAEARFRQN